MSDVNKEYKLCKTPFKQSMWFEIKGESPVTLYVHSVCLYENIASTGTVVLLYYTFEFLLKVCDDMLTYALGPFFRCDHHETFGIK